MPERNVGEGSAVVSARKAVISGSFCQNDDRFEPYQNSQCTAMSVSALYHSKIKDPSSWNTATIDSVLMDGHKL